MVETACLHNLAFLSRVYGLMSFFFFFFGFRQASAAEFLVISVLGHSSSHLMRSRGLKAHLIPAQESY